MRRIAILLGGLQILLTAAPAWALITELTPLTGVLKENQFICMALVERIDPDKPGMVLTVDEVLKGKPPFKKLAVNLTGDAYSQKKKETPLLLKRVAPKLSVLLFVRQNDKDFTAFAYSNGTWFQMAGVRADDDGDVLRLPFTHFEPFLRRTFKGTTAELKQIAVEGLSGKAEPPDPDKKAKAGLGPEVESPNPPNNKNKEESFRPNLARGPVFGVIPMLVVGPLALLAMLFPAVFGGLMLVLKRWTTALGVLSVNSLLLFLQNWFGAYLITSWWGTPAALWLAMSLVTVWGTLWAWRKHAARLATPGAYATRFANTNAPGLPVASTQFTWSRPMARTVDFFPPPALLRFEPPHKGELFTLGALSLFCLATAFFLPRSFEEFGPMEKTVVMFNVGVWAATLHACYLRWVVARRPAPRPGLPGEGVLLGAMLVLCVALAFTMTPEGRGADQPKEVKIASEHGARSVQVRELFKPAPSSWIASSPLVDGDRIYVGAVHGEQYQSGAIYCLDRTTGAVRWTFNDGGKMKNVFSSPCVVNGRLYTGEGFHQHRDCKFYCLNADTGAKLWEVRTGSHTESSPCVVDGKVFFGAGDDGLYCVNAADGSPVWHEAKGLHVDADPLVVGGRVFCGSGVGDAYQETCVFCLDAADGKEIWRKPTDLPIWGEAALAGGRLYVGLGNGNFMDSDEKPAGAVQCYDAANGERIWRYDVADGVHVRLAVDRDRVYFGSRDHYCYCLKRSDGKPLWKKDLGSPVVASPELLRLDGSPGCGCSVGLYVVASEGQVYCLDPATGEAEWTLDLGKGQKDPTLFSSPAVAVSREADGEHRRVYFGSGFNFFRRGALYCVEDVMERPITAK